MRSLLSLPSTVLSFLTLAVMVLTVRTATAGTNPNPSCVTLVKETPEAYAITIGWSCDLREATRRFPQLDAETRKPLPTQVQLRSIFAENERRAQEAGLKTATVRQGCVRSTIVPEGASAEERQACPNGLVNYFGVASFGPQHTLIWVPKSRVASQSERLEALGRSACAAIGAVQTSADQLPPARRAALEKAATDCRSQMPDTLQAGAKAAEASSDPPPPSVTALTQELDDTRATVGRLESQLQVKDTQAAMVAPRLQVSQWVPTLIVAMIALLLGNLIQVLLHFRQRRAVRAQRQVLVDRDRLARALRALENEFDSRVAAIREEKDATIEQMRLSTAQLEVELLETAASQAEAHRSAEEQRWSRALEETHEEMNQRLQQSLDEAREESRQAMEQLALARQEMERMLTDLSTAQQESAQNLRRATSLQHRLQMARSRNAYLEAGSIPDPDDRTSQPELIVAAG